MLSSSLRELLTFYVLVKWIEQSDHVTRTMFRNVKNSNLLNFVIDVQSELQGMFLNYGEFEGKIFGKYFGLL